MHGPNGERGCARLALTDADREGRDLVVTWMRDLGLDVSRRRDRQRRRHPARQRPEPAGRDDRLAHRHRPHRGAVRRQPRRARRAGSDRDVDHQRIETERGVAVAFFTDEEGARFAPDMLGSLVFVGGMALEAALDVAAADDGARLGDELARIGYAGPVPCPSTAFPALVRRAPHRAGPDPRGRGHRDRGRHRRAGHLLDRGDDHRSVGPCRHDADADAPRPRLCRGADRRPSCAI